ncbi:hypothetical protein HCZ30_15155 [Marivivens donghaensis]|uniref:Cation/H+ exchanger transmembrane domain-containing protein n=1 Tax=Marivivens donghaensis TaxID=1699413 RepID=A0ABX0W0P5_9RHOB|nr:cation:proton antiporter [Marivivens donghaensis]NIY73766.1 hypothetical protein [Marivivens donghaensis]
MEGFDLFIISTGIILYALISGKADKKSFTGPIAFTVFGLVVGAGLLDLIDIPIHNEALNTLAEITLVVTLFCDAARIDVTKLSREHNLPIKLLALGLPMTMALGAAVAWAIFPEIGIGAALLIGIALAPTDAALGQAVVSNKAVPQRIRQALNVESGLNDGLAYPALLIAVSIAIATSEARGASAWVAFVAAQVVLGPLVGIIIGGIGGRWAEKSAASGAMNEAFSQIIVLGLALASYSGAEIVGGNGFLAAFAAGLMIARRAKHIVREATQFGEAEGQLLGLIVFIVFGAVLVPDAFKNGMDWRIWPYAILSLTVIRMAPVAISLIGSGLRPNTVAFIGWFGPRGLASILYVLLLLEESEISMDGVIVQTVFATVILSIIAHGLSAVPFARAYAASTSKDAEEESKQVHSFAHKSTGKKRVQS